MSEVRGKWSDCFGLIGDKSTQVYVLMCFCSFADVMASVKLIPKPKEPLLLPKPGGDGCVHCAVVGTAGILNGSKVGAEIDAHDYVFRMNGAVTKGYEEDVGNRTSVYVHTQHSITASRYIFGKYGYKSAPHDEGIKYVLIPEAMRDFQWLEGLFKGNESFSGPHHKKCKDFFLSLFLYPQVDAYGFMTDDYMKYSNYYVQKYIKTRVIFYANHDYKLEKNTWKDLHNRKIIKLYQRTEPESGTEKPK
uniref:alpha-N-acetylgalactosaminide alpha-2,6-sialyltransferase n=1 Tax=Oreochromis aureus TaxID=47969 RepID=A0A668UEG4_OREAU